MDERVEELSVMDLIHAIDQYLRQASAPERNNMIRQMTQRLNYYAPLSLKVKHIGEPVDAG